VATQLRRVGSLEGIDVRLQFDPELPCAAVDPAQLGQILLNLLSNALQAMGEGGHGTLTVTGEQRPDGRVCLTVADSGPGIAPDVIPRIFEPLFTTKARGLGLGLWVSRTLAHANGGDLAVTSRPGDGARFLLTMPSVARSAEAA
jgi:signal transduction histidine kinase